MTMFIPIYSVAKNYCATNNGGCDQTCTNGDNGAVCSCISGYTLDNDGKGCSGMYMYIVDYYCYTLSMWMSQALQW